MQKINSYAHLLSSVEAKAKEVKGDKDAEPIAAPEAPKNDKPDGKKASKKAAKDEGETDEEHEEGESDKGEEDKEESDREEKRNKERDDKEDKKGKKSKKASASDDVTDVRLEATLAERLRCATIFQSAAASGRPDIAARFAFHTNLSAEEAEVLMDGFKSEAPKSRRESLDQRMSRVQNPSVGEEAPAGSQSAHGVTIEQMSAMTSDQKALLIVNAGRQLSGEAPLSKLSN